MHARRRPGGASDNAAVRRWLHPRCARFWDASHPEPLASNGSTGSRLQLPLTMSREDVCPRGRQVVYPWHRASEVVLIPQLRLAYVVVRKCASTTILRALAAAFGNDQHHCGTEAAKVQCATFTMPDEGRYRCSTACLDAVTVSEYSFFTFVRDPVDRFYSAMVTAAAESDRVDREQGVKRSKIRGAHGAGREQMVETLRRIRGCSPRDQHYESMAMALSSPWGSEFTTPLEAGTSGIRRAPPMIPIDFIGHVESLWESFVQMLHESERYHMVRTKQLDILRTHLNGSRLNSRTATGRLGSYARLYDSIRDPELDGIIRAAYSQDVECFGYGKGQRHRAGMDSPKQVAAGSDEDVYEFDNGVRLARRFLTPGQLARYKLNPVVLHEPAEEAWLSALLFGATKGAVFVDVGAAAGYYCMLALRMRPNLAVVAVNPSAYFRGALETNAALQRPPVHVAYADEKNLQMLRAPDAGTVLQIAAIVSGDAGRIPIRASIGNEYGDSMKPTTSDNDKSTVPVLTLRQVLPPGKSVHLAMLDVQGEEERIFHSRDAHLLLREHRIERLLVGIHGNGPEQKRRVSAVVVGALKAAGYIVVFEQLVFADQPDGLLVAVAPQVRMGPIEAAPVNSGP